MPIFTDFSARGQVGILDWYTSSVAVFSATLLAAHGATYLQLETRGPVRERSGRQARRLWIAVFLLLPIVSLQTWDVRPDLYLTLGQRPLAWLGVPVVAAGAWALWSGLRGQGERRALAGSCAVIAGLLAGAAASVFPVILHSTLAPRFSLTAYNGTTDERGLRMAAIWWPVALVLALTYFVLVMRSYRGKLGPADQKTNFSAS
jgi:cytochrome d ubiquinol oxidase subunit II